MSLLIHRAIKRAYKMSIEPYVAFSMFCASKLSYMKLTGIKLALAGLLLTASVVGGGCAPKESLDARLSEIVKPYAFSVLTWELKALADEATRVIRGNKESEGEVQTVRDFFRLGSRIDTLNHRIEAIRAGRASGNIALLETEIATLEKQRLVTRDTVSQTIARQIQTVLSDEGIHNPFTDWKINFPRVSFRLEKPPHVLVISPRSEIFFLKGFAMKQEMSVAEMEEIEAKADSENVSSLVLVPGGLATYPSIIDDSADLHYTIQVVTLEWMHHYLAFTPLGFHFLLSLTGLRTDYDIHVMNETVAHMVGEEISNKVYERYYSTLSSLYATATPTAAGETFDFEAEMREIRLTVENYLRRGQIEQAEQYMNDKRDYLESKGHYIRKLNQAYFAFHDSYADTHEHDTTMRLGINIVYTPATDDIGTGLQKLRNQAPSLKDFLARVAIMTGVEDLRRALETVPQVKIGSGLITGKVVELQRKRMESSTVIELIAKREEALCA